MPDKTTNLQVAMHRVRAWLSTDESIESILEHIDVLLDHPDGKHLNLATEALTRGKNSRDTSDRYARTGGGQSDNWDLEREAAEFVRVYDGLVARAEALALRAEIKLRSTPEWQEAQRVREKEEYAAHLRSEARFAQDRLTHHRRRAAVEILLDKREALAKKLQVTLLTCTAILFSLTIYLVGQHLVPWYVPIALLVTCFLVILGISDFRDAERSELQDADALVVLIKTYGHNQDLWPPDLR